MSSHLIQRNRRHQRARRETLEREVGAFADAADKEVAVVPREAELVEAGDAAAHLHRQRQQVAGAARALDLDLRGRLAVERPCIIAITQVDEPRQPLLERDVHVEHDVLHALVAAQRPAHDFALLRVFADAVERARQRRQRKRRDEEPAAVERLRHHPEAFVQVAEQVAFGNAHAVEHNRAGRRLRPEVLACHLLVVHSPRVHRDDEAARAVARLPVGSGQRVDDDVRRPLRVGRPALLAADDPAVAVARRADLRVGGVGPARRLREAEDEHALAGSQVGEVRRLLRVAAAEL